MSLVQKVKDMQRNDPKAKEQWWAYADVEGNGVRDPAKHDETFLETFIENYSAGMVFKVEGGGDSDKLAELIKMGQRKSHAWKQCWRAYCQSKGQFTYDPTTQSLQFLTKFLDFVGTAGSDGGKGKGKGKGKGAMMNPMMMNPMMMGMMGGGMGKGMMGMMGKAAGKGGKGGGKRSSPYTKGMDSEKTALVNRVKAFQKSGDENKQQWWEYADSSGKDKRDPAAYESEELSSFCDMYGVP